MPKASDFFGVSIYVYWRDHGPSHFHAVYGDDEASVSIEDPRMLDGRLSPRVLGLVIEWASLHREELRQVWLRAKRLEPLGTIEPLT